MRAKSLNTFKLKMMKEKDKEIGMGCDSTTTCEKEASFAEIERRIQQLKEETWQIVRETSEQMKETDRMMKETSAQMKETDRKMKQLFDQFTTQWGRVLEEVTKPAALKLFKDIGIEIEHVFQESRHRKREEDEMEADVILVNTTAVVVVEVKTTLKTHDVDYFLKQMEKFKELFREFKDRTVYVAVAAIKFDGDSDVYARKKGVFVLRCNGESIFGLDNVPEERRRKY